MFFFWCGLRGIRTFVVVFERLFGSTETALVWWFLGFVQPWEIVPFTHASFNGGVLTWGYP